MVDDDPAVAEMIGIVLRGDGFDPIFCDHGDRAVDVFRAEQPDVILLDLMLPGRSGIDICREIRGESGVPIIMLTAKSDTVDVVLGLESGADDYIPKPFKPREPDRACARSPQAPRLGRGAGAAHRRPRDRRHRSPCHPRRRPDPADAARV
ncbi:hypothetical protein GCM10025876_27220 [Demequina litorisediminis]|uniref:Response regulatory domain-containing protein n=1 Tax=Demequina litorisediminis TaxID=1849022 RepID=A0ABQ6IF54_9MICO|nr:hypothetical protein GCM10025876_27220 [Demequina litorisediminis]